MKYLLDTNVISEVSKHDKADANVVAWYNSVEQDSVCLSVLVIGEIRAGIEKLRVDRPKRASDFERRLILTIDLFADRIISIDRRVAERWGRLNAERKRAAVDALLAATAWVHGLVMVTRNIRDFADTDVACLEPVRVSALISREDAPMTTVRVATFAGPGAPPVIREVPRPAVPAQGGADPDRRLRGLRHRSAHPERPLAEALALAVHARPRARRRDRRDRAGADRGLDAGSRSRSAPRSCCRR